MSAAASPAYSAEFEARVYRRVTRRLIPFLFLCYIFAYVDRVNVGFAKLQMQQDLRLSDAAYGLAAGMFFIGYFFFEVPCNMLMQRIGAKYWLGPIMIVWGLVSASTMLVKTSGEFYLVRFVLGLVESGFFPGVIFYLTFWYSSTRRAKMVASFMTAVPLSGAIGGPISGWLLDHFSSTGGLRGWQWLYVIEAVPSILAGIATAFFLQNGPEKAKWLDADEKALLTARLAEDESRKRTAPRSHVTLADAFRSPRTWLLCFIYFGFVMGNYGISFWLPQIVKETLATDPFRIGLLTTVPWGLAAIAMVLVGHHSDRTGERRWHIAVAGILSAAAFSVSAVPGISGVLGFAALTVATAAVACAYSTFWALPTAFLSGAAASAGIAWINSVGNLAGYLSPFMVGKIRDATHHMAPALLVIAASALGASLLTIFFFAPHKNAHDPT